MDYKYKISIITATYNAAEHLPRLIASLRAQTDQDFEWVVADGASTDETLELLESIKDLHIKITSQEDFGIYDALNRGIKASSGEFYLVMGADDVLYPNGVKDYKEAIEDGVDIVTARIIKDRKIHSALQKKTFRAAMGNYVSSHAVGSIFRRALHEKYGYYSKKFPIAADQLFVVKSCKDMAKVKKIGNLIGEFRTGGVSTTDIVGFLTEYYRVQLAVGENKLLQTSIFILRIIKHYSKLK